MVKIFGIKGKKFARFGSKIMKSATLGLKTGGKMGEVLGTALGSPQIIGAAMAAEAAGAGIERVRRATKKGGREIVGSVRSLAHSM
jgi:hypothetical protein